MPKIAIVRVRGRTKIKKEIEDTLKMLRIYRPNYCSIFEATPSIIGMVKKAKDYITWGEIDSETIALLEKKKGKRRFYRLSPPRGGWERKGIKIPFKLGGALGDRKKEINKLIRRML